LTDYAEVTVWHTNATLTDTDSDGLNDGLEVLTYHTNATSVDTDGDGIRDKDEVDRYPIFNATNAHTFNSTVTDYNYDYDHDGLSNG
jgi:hypothetical protein